MKFKVGDRVQIVKGTRHYGADDANPADVEGVVTSDDESDEHNLYVDWDNGTNNSYEDSDLEAAPPVSTGIESILEQYAAIKSSDDMIQEARGSAYGEMVAHVNMLLEKTPGAGREHIENLFSEREQQYMEKHHAGDETYQKGNGTWNMSMVFDGAYKSAKSTVLGAVGAGVTLLQEDGTAKGKSRLGKETKERMIQPVDTLVSVAMSKAAELVVAYAHLSDPEEREVVREFIHSSII